MPCAPFHCASLPPIHWSRQNEQLTEMHSLEDWLVAVFVWCDFFALFFALLAWHINTVLRISLGLAIQSLLWLRVMLHQLILVTSFKMSLAKIGRTGKVKDFSGHSRNYVARFSREILMIPNTFVSIWSRFFSRSLLQHTILFSYLIFFLLCFCLFSFCLKNK